MTDAELANTTTNNNDYDDNNHEGEEHEQSFWKSKVIGDYDYVRLCTPRWNPWRKDDKEPLPFYNKDDRLAWLLAAFLGFQHSLTVVGGTVIPGILLGNQDPTGKAGPYLVSYALLTSGK